MNHSLKSADSGTHFKIVAVSLAVALVSILALSSVRLHDIGVSEIVAKPAVRAAVKASPTIRMAEATTLVGWTRDVLQPDAAAKTRQK